MLKMGRVSKGNTKKTKKVSNSTKGRKVTNKAAGMKAKEEEKTIDLSAILVENKILSDESEEDEEEVDEGSDVEEGKISKEGFTKYLSGDSTDMSSDSDDESKLSEDIEVKKASSIRKKGKKSMKKDIENDICNKKDIKEGRKTGTGKKGKKTPYSPGDDGFLSDEERAGGKGGGRGRSRKGGMQSPSNTEPRSREHVNMSLRGHDANLSEVERIGDEEGGGGRSNMRGDQNRNNGDGQALTSSSGTPIGQRSNNGMYGSGGGRNNRNNIVVRDLASFGLNPAPVRLDDTGGFNNGGHNTSEIRIAIVGGVNGQSDILFRCEPTGFGNRNNSWCEKVMYDAVKAPESWVSNFNISKNVFYWYNNNVEQLNRSNYGIRLFHIPLVGNINHNALVELFGHICEIITTSERNSERITVNPGQLYWLNGPVVWSDVVGNAKAMSMLKKRLGNPYPGFYEANEEEILTFFKKENTEAMIELFGPMLENNLD
jgi:hypothetical protein